MSTQKLKNRWLIAASAVGIHISIGSVYAYSVMTNPVKDIFDVDGSVIKWAFKIAILLLGLSAAFLGRWVEKVGPKISGTTAGIFYGVGIRLVDFKIEIGKIFEADYQRLVVADEISPDSCRLWDVETGRKLDKDVFRRDLGDLADAYTEVARRLGVMPSNVTHTGGKPTLIN